MAQTYRYPAGSTISITSQGTNGSANPSTSLQVGGVSPTSTLLPLAVDASGQIIVSSIAGTSDVNLTKVGGANITEGQKVMAASLPVVLASDQTLPLPAGAATSAKQDTGNTSLSSIDTKTPALGQALAAASVPVVLTAAQLTILTPLSTVAATQSGTWNINNVSGTVSLPTGASTSAKQDTGNTSLASIDGKFGSLGQKNSAGSAPVVIASDQSVLTTTNSDTVSTGNITTQNLNPSSGTATANSTISVNSLNGTMVAGIQVTGTYTGALTPQVTIDGSNWTAVTNLKNVNTGLLSATITSGTTGLWQAEIAGAVGFRISANAAVTGTAVVTVRASTAQALVQLQGSLPAGTAIIGALSANQSVNLNTLAGTGISTGNGVAGTGVQRVTIASDNTAFSVNAVQSGTWTVQPGNTANTTAWLVSQDKAATSTVTSVASSASSVSLLALNTSRKNATFFNDSTAILYLKLGATASTSSYTVQIQPGGYYELPVGRIYTGAIDGIWASANGNARITELS